MSECLEVDVEAGVCADDPVIFFLDNHVKPWDNLMLIFYD